MVPAPGADEARLARLVEVAVDTVRRRLRDLNLDMHVFDFDGPPLASPGALFEPLDYLEIGLAEKLEREINFLLIVTESEMVASKLSYSLAYPSRLTNIGLISVRRLTPDFWGKESDRSLAGRRLGVLMVHTLGHILNLSHDPDQSNVMHDFHSVDDLDLMEEISQAQQARVAESVVEEAHDETARGVSFGFWWSNVVSNLPSIGRTLKRANPLRLMAKLPTLLTTALSVVIILFFSPEVWEVAEAVSIYQIALFIIVAISVATAVTQATSFLAVLFTVLAVWLVFLALTYAAAVTIFPDALVARWTPVESPGDSGPQLNLSLFLASMAVLTGSLGGKADSKRLVRTVLFLDEET